MRGSTCKRAFNEAANPSSGGLGEIVLVLGAVNTAGQRVCTYATRWHTKNANEKEK